MVPFTCQFPRALQLGDGVLLAAPARFVTKEQIAAAEQCVTQAGYTPVVYPGILERNGQFGGDDAQRAAYLNAGFEDEQVRAIWAMRGGYGCGRILPLLNVDCFQQDAKWLMGFSDTTALHAWAQNAGVASLHAPVANTFNQASPSLQLRFWSAVAKGKHNAVLPPASPVVGGNLSVLYSLLGTPHFPPVDGAWLLLEDLDEYLYHIDRMLLAFRLAGVFQRVHGVLVGAFTDLHDNTIAHGQSVDNPFGRNLEAMLADHVPNDTPIVFDIPAGHIRENEPVVLGSATDQSVAWTQGF